LFGFIVPPNNAALLAKAMQKILTLSLEDKKQMGLASFEIIKQTYELSKVVQRWLKLYQIS
jgi:glycosyltransferase involved in cell wall biosynthesis